MYKNINENTNDNTVNYIPNESSNDYYSTYEHRVGKIKTYSSYASLFFIHFGRLIKAFIIILAFMLINSLNFLDEKYPKFPYIDVILFNTFDVNKSCVLSLLLSVLILIIV